MPGRSCPDRAETSSATTEWTSIPPDRWAAELELRQGGSHVLQEFVEAPLHALMVPAGDSFAPVSRHLHLGEFVLDGRMAGFLARVSVGTVLSAASDEHAIPCYLPASGV